jgi:hypothetical protein
MINLSEPLLNKKKNKKRIDIEPWSPDEDSLW